MLLRSILLAPRIQPIPVHWVMVLVFGWLWKTQSDIDPGCLCEPHSSRSAVILKMTYFSGVSLGSRFWHYPGKDYWLQKQLLRHSWEKGSPNRGKLCKFCPEIRTSQSAHLQAQQAPHSSVTTPAPQVRFSVESIEVRTAIKAYLVRSLFLGRWSSTLKALHREILVSIWGDELFLQLFTHWIVHVILHTR